MPLKSLLKFKIEVKLEILQTRSCHYFSCPRLSWDPMSKMSGVWLEKIVDMYLVLEKGLR